MLFLMLTTVEDATSFASRACCTAVEAADCTVAASDFQLEASSQDDMLWEGRPREGCTAECGARKARSKMTWRIQDLSVYHPYGYGTVLPVGLGAPPSTMALSAATLDEDDELCLLCCTTQRNVRYIPCGHAVTCAKCAVRHVLSQLRQGELLPRCAHGCGTEIKRVMRLEMVGAPVPIYTAGNPNSDQLSGYSLDTFLESMVEDTKDDAAAALEMWTDGQDSRLQAAFFDAVEAGDLSEARALRAEGASIHAEDDQQLMPLHICSQLGHIEASTPPSLARPEDWTHTALRSQHVLARLARLARLSPLQLLTACGSSR